jgi:hypothetical protein
MNLSLFHLGWVQTGMVGEIENFKISQTGAFKKYDSTHLPW